jgi:hypothetical protein
LNQPHRNRNLFEIRASEAQSIIHIFHSRFSVLNSAVLSPHALRGNLWQALSRRWRDGNLHAAMTMQLLRNAYKMKASAEGP